MQALELPVIVGKPISIFHVDAVARLRAPVTLDDAAPQTFAICVSGLSNSVYNGAPLPAALPGAPGCNLLVSADVLDLYVTNAQGSASATFSIPASSAYIGADVFHQWAIVDGVNSLGVVVSEGGRATIDQ